MSYYSRGMNIKSWLLVIFSCCDGASSAYSYYSKSDWEARDTWVNTAKMFQLAQIDTGSVVADVGCHEGYLTLRLAKKVGQTRMVYAVDLRDDRI